MALPPAENLNTADLCALIERIHAGDRVALDELLRRSAARLERMARKMLRRYPRVRRREQTADVVNEATLSLMVALRQLHFSSTRQFYGLAAEHVRRRLLDLARRFAGPRGAVTSLEAVVGAAERIAAPGEDEELERWQALHEAVETLPDDVREVFSLRFYHGLSNAEIAGQLGVCARTVQRRHVEATEVLLERLGGRPLPG